MVAILSVGSARALMLRPRAGGAEPQFPLGHGDLIVMGGSCQRTWEHAIPKTARPVGPRVSIQFRPVASPDRRLEPLAAVSHRGYWRPTGSRGRPGTLRGPAAGAGDARRRRRARMKTVMGWIDRSSPSLARRKVNKDEGRATRAAPRRPQRRSARQSPKPGTMAVGARSAHATTTDDAGGSRRHGKGLTGDATVRGGHGQTQQQAADHRGDRRRRAADRRHPVLHHPGRRLEPPARGDHRRRAEHGAAAAARRLHHRHSRRVQREGRADGPDRELLPGFRPHGQRQVLRHRRQLGGFRHRRGEPGRGLGPNAQRPRAGRLDPGRVHLGEPAEKRPDRQGQAQYRAGRARRA